MFKILLNVTAAVLVGAAILLQDYTLATNFGITASQDFYQFSYLIASNLWNVLSGGTYLAVAIPLLLNLQSKTTLRMARDIYFKFSVVYASLVVVSCLALYFFLDYFLATFYKNGAGIHNQNITIQLLIASIPIHLVASYFSGIVICQKLNSAVTMSSALIYLAIPLWSAFKNFNTTQAAVLVCVGVITQTVILILIARITGVVTDDAEQILIVERPNKAIVRSLKEVAKIIISSLLVALLNWLITVEYGAQGVGEISKFVFATKPVNLAAAFLTIVIANYLLASFSEAVADGDFGKLQKNIIFTYLAIVVTSAVAISVWYLLGDIFYGLMFMKSGVNLEHISEIKKISNIVIFQLPLYMLGVVAWRGLNALSRNTEILKASICAIAFLYLLRIVVPVNWEYRMSIIYIGVYFVWAVYLVASLARITRNLAIKSRGY